MGESDSKKSIETWLKTSLAFRNVITRATPHRFAHGKKQIGGGSLFYKKQPINCRDSLLSFYYELKLWMSEGWRLWCIRGFGACAQAETACSLVTEIGAQGLWKQILQENYDIIDVFIDWKIDFVNLSHHTTYFYYKYRFNLSETYSQMASGHRLAKWVTEHWSVIASFRRSDKSGTQNRPLGGDIFTAVRQPMSRYLPDPDPEEDENYIVKEGEKLIFKSSNTDTTAFFFLT